MPPLAPPFLKLLFPRMMPYDMKHPFGQFMSAVLAVFSPSLLSTPSLPALEEVEKTENLDTVWALCRIVKILLCCQHCLNTNPKHNTVLFAIKKVKFISARCTTIKSQKEDPGSYQLVSHSSVPVLDAMLRHMEDRKVIWEWQHGFHKG